MPEELLENSDLEVLQDGTPLSRDEIYEDRWWLEQIVGEVTVCSTDKTVSQIGLASSDSGHLVFRLGGRQRSQGRRVNSPCSGSYLVVVPDDWERDEELCGHASVAPEPVSLEGHRGHFFDLDHGSNQKIAFRTAAGESIQIEALASRFELVGARLNDANHDLGPLFGLGPPQIRTLSDQAWVDIETIVTGEEGSAKGRWRTQFRPVPGRMDQDPPSEVSARRSGWYFHRFYDANDDLVDSLDFRFVCELRDIRVRQPDPLPSEAGHGAVSAEFYHDSSCGVQMADGLPRSVQIRREEEKTILTLPPDPACDETRWLVHAPRRPQVQVSVLVERVWWATGREETEPREWTDRRLALSRGDFDATSDKAIWVRLPRPRWTDAVHIGFERSKARLFPVRVTEKTVAIPLREFADVEEVEDEASESTLQIWIERDGGPPEGAIAFIPAIQQRKVPAPPPIPGPTAQWTGLGRKKTAVAKAVLRDEPGEIRVNGQPLWGYFKAVPQKAKRFLRRLLDLEQVRAALMRMEVRITVTGSSPHSARQARAVAHALARALMNHDPGLKLLLKQHGFGGARVTRLPKGLREGQSYESDRAITRDRREIPTLLGDHVLLQRPRSASIL